MFLNSIHLQNVRCFRDASLNFDRPGGQNRKWTVLLGENGTGKSTLIKSIALILCGSDALPELIGDPDSWISTNADTARIQAIIETKPGEPRELVLQIRRGEGVSELIARSLETLKPLNDALDHTSRNYLTIGYGASRRLTESSEHRRSSRSELRHPRARSLATLFRGDMELAPLEEWAMRLDYRSNGDALETVRAVLSDFLPEMTFSHIDRKRETLVFDTPDGEVPLSQLSDGYKNVAGWVGDLLVQITDIFEDYHQPLHARALLIIDEIDLHLHPKWQRRLLDFLDARLPQMQLIVTTHALVTAQQAPEGSLHYCMRREGGSTVEEFGLDPGDLLLHELIATEAFGRLSDESLTIEAQKDEYRAIYERSDRTEFETERMRTISDRMRKRPDATGSDIVMTDKQRALVAEILHRQTTIDE